jgi:hypothetical protein
MLRAGLDTAAQRGQLSQLSQHRNECRSLSLISAPKVKAGTRASSLIARKVPGCGSRTHATSPHPPLPTILLPS